MNVYDWERVLIILFVIPSGPHAFLILIFLIALLISKDLISGGRGVGARRMVCQWFLTIFSYLDSGESKLVRMLAWCSAIIKLLCL